MSNKINDEIDEASCRKDLEDARIRIGELAHLPTMVEHFSAVLNLIHTTSGEASEWRRDVIEGLGDARQAEAHRENALKHIERADTVTTRLVELGASMQREPELQSLAVHVKAAQSATGQAEYFHERAAITNTNIPTKLLYG
jgi:hypothetical protein